ILGIGLAIPKDLERRLQILSAQTSEAEQSKDISFASRVSRATGFEVFVYNDGNAGCWGELMAYPAPRPEHLVYIRVGHFISSGLITERTLWEGPGGHSGNLGSMMLTDFNGCRQLVHLIVSLNALERKLIDRNISIPDGSPSTWNWDAIESIAAGWIDEAGRALAETIQYMCHG
ncbi:MAG: ROK family protein, partial [Pseudorhodobacter sp.]|nr:ROK family protein [Pseudorhodobacter sp.]